MKVEGPQESLMTQLNSLVEQERITKETGPLCDREDSFINTTETTRNLASSLFGFLQKP